ncbi:MAG: ferritin-like fold-containing protein [Dermatophilaceae bacterium]
MAQTSDEDPHYRAAVVDLLGVLAYGELTAFIRMAVDSDLAPTLSLKSSMAQLANAEYLQYVQLVERMTAMGIEPEPAMAPFVAPLTAYHERTKPKGWLEGLVKAYVGEGIAKDFYREMSALVDAETRAVMNLALDDAAETEFIVSIVRDALRTDRTAAGRLALWGRRLLGEALSQAQAVAVERDAMSALLVGGGVDLAEVGAMFTRLTTNHEKRMNRLGLAA